MSLAQHVTQAEGFDYDGPAAPAPEPEQERDRGQENEQNQRQEQGHQEGQGQEQEIDQETTQQDVYETSENGLMSPSTIVVEDPEYGPKWQRLSHALIEVTPPRRQRSSAYYVSNTKRFVQVTTGVVSCWLASSIVFGFAALRPVLISEGVYRNLCPGEEHSGEIPCKEQDMRLNLFFIVGSITANVSSLFAGASLDRFGRRVCWIISSICLAAGTLIMTASFAYPSFDGYIVGNIILSLGGTYLFVPTFELANAFPLSFGLIVALVTGAFDASSAVFLFYRIAYDASKGAFTPATFFGWYLSVPLVILATELIYMPAHGYHTMSELEVKIERAQNPDADAHASDDNITDRDELIRVRNARADHRHDKLSRMESLAGNTFRRRRRFYDKDASHEASGVWGVLHGHPFRRQIRSPWFTLILAMTVIQMFRMNYFISTIHRQYTYMLGSEEKAEWINHFFDVALPVGGVATTPVIGVLLNSLRVSTITGLLTGFIVFNAVLNCLPFLWAGYATVLTFVLFRPFYYSAISDYSTKVFGFVTFGRIYGTLVCISGLFNFAQSGVDILVYGHLLNGNPTPVNIVLGIVGTIIGLGLTAFVIISGRAFATVKADREAYAEAMETRRLLYFDNISYGAVGR
ncbi:Sugar (and other) transporter [Geosmithia morbida]|uniref:Sugar (And other) transporter n=1 Tax=Geosmithia morbida TaxID=1094350 RepID=A0A9P5CZK5_9HYPO|nr:Sugar (and other) transporter [Geosmithia morbida]KAF4121683.1 Sugar (and other) transporter [Geosmithia morbida]